MGQVRALGAFVSATSLWDLKQRFGRRTQSCTEPTQRSWGWAFLWLVPLQKYQNCPVGLFLGEQLVQSTVGHLLRSSAVGTARIPRAGPGQLLGSEIPLVPF